MVDDSKIQSQIFDRENLASAKQRAQYAVRQLAQKINSARKAGVKLNKDELIDLKADAESYYYTWLRKNQIFTKFQFFLIAAILTAWLMPLYFLNNMYVSIGKTVLTFAVISAIILFLKVMFYDVELSLEKYIKEMFSASGLSKYTLAAIFSLLSNRDGVMFCINKKKIIVNYVFAILIFALSFYFTYIKSIELQKVFKQYEIVGVVVSLALLIFQNYQDYCDFEEE